jgi:tetratricopeptide (TPR) repeat protein
LRLAAEIARESLAVTPEEPYAIALTASVAVAEGRFDDSIAHARKVRDLAPNDPMLLNFVATCLIPSGEPALGAALVRQAMRLNPYSPNHYLSLLAFALDLLGQPGEAIAALRCAVERDPNYLPAHIRLASLLARSGRMDEAKRAAAEVMRINPRFRVATGPLSLYAIRDRQAMQRIVDGLILAGLPLEREIALDGNNARSRP